MKKDVYEHLSRLCQEIYHLVRINHIYILEQLISRYDQGYGCGVRKPLMALVLASCWSEHLLKLVRLPLQDTDDCHFANTQKDRIYSVVLRMAVGGVTSDGLIAIG